MLGFLLGYLKAWPYHLATLAIVITYDAWVDDPSVASEARSGYVTEVRLHAKDAELREMKRQATAARDAADTFERALKAANEEQEARQQIMEKEIEAYVKELKDAGRACPLSDSDIEWLRK